MKPRSSFVAACILLSLASACGRKPAGMIVVYEDHLDVIGRAKVSLGGRFGIDRGSIDPWRPGNAVVFRVDKTVESSGEHSFTGKAGKVYWITDQFELDEMGQADLSKSDGDIARRFGVETKQ